MRFDATRVIEMAEWLGNLEGDDERREEATARLVAEGFENLGWSVDRQSEAVVASRPSSAPTRIVIQSPLRRARQAPWWGRLRRAIGRLRGREIVADGFLEVGVRTGLAFLLELARTWPASRSSRVDLTFAAARGARFVLPAVPEPRPTLFLDVLAPGMGQGIMIGGRCRELVLGAARDLWIPHRERWWITTLLSPSALIVGDGAFGGEAPRIDPGALDRTAQLVTEVALRWAKAKSAGPGSPQEEDDRRASRSSQKPG